MGDFLHCIVFIIWEQCIVTSHSQSTSIFWSLCRSFSPRLESAIIFTLYFSYLLFGFLALQGWLFSTFPIHHPCFSGGLLVSYLQSACLIIFFHRKPVLVVLVFSKVCHTEGGSSPFDDFLFWRERLVSRGIAQKQDNSWPDVPDLWGGTWPQGHCIPVHPGILSIRQFFYSTGVALTPLSPPLSYGWCPWERVYYLLFVHNDIIDLNAIQSKRLLIKDLIKPLIKTLIKPLIKRNYDFPLIF